MRTTTKWIIRNRIAENNKIEIERSHKPNPANSAVAPKDMGFLMYRKGPITTNSRGNMRFPGDSKIPTFARMLPHHKTRPPPTAIISNPGMRSQ